MTINEILDQALDLKGEEREAYLDSACFDDSELRDKVVRLLDGFANNAPSDLMRNAVPIPDLPDLPPAKGRWIKPANGRRLPDRETDLTRKE